MQALSTGYIHGQTRATIEMSPPSQRATTLSPRLDGCRTGDQQSGSPRTQIKAPKLPKGRHQEQTHTQQGPYHPSTIDGRGKAERWTRDVE